MALLTVVIPCARKYKLGLSLAHCSYSGPVIQKRFLHPDLNASAASNS